VLGDDVLKACKEVQVFAGGDGYAHFRVHFL
jgi:hypothetical protein